MATTQLKIGVLLALLALGTAMMVMVWDNLLSVTLDHEHRITKLEERYAREDR